MDASSLWAAAIGALPASVAAVLSYRTIQHAKDTGKKADENHAVLKTVERQTNGEMTHRIREVVRNELIDHPERTAEMHELLDAILRNVQGEDFDDV